MFDREEMWGDYLHYALYTLHYSLEEAIKYANEKVGEWQE